MNSLQARLYALTHRGTPGDATFYARACAGAESVLELGCGYGRLLPHLARSAARYRGLDISPELLCLARQERRKLAETVDCVAILSRADMRTFRFRERFDKIVMPHSAIYCLSSQRAVLQCLANARRHLKTSGELILDAYGADDFHAHAREETMRGDQRDWLTTLEHAGEQLQVFETTRWRRTQQKLRVTYDYELSSGKNIRHVIHHRYLLKPQLDALLVTAGFSRRRFFGGFAEQRYTARSDTLLVRALL